VLIRGLLRIQRKIYLKIEVMQTNSYVFLMIFMGVLFFLIAVVMLYWCVKSGQLKDFDKNSRSIFSEDEPEGEETDFFPGARNKLKNLSSE